MLASLPAQLFYHACRIVADAIDRKHYQIGAAGHAWQQQRVIFHAAIMVQERRPQSRRNRAQIDNLMGTAADIEQCDAIQA